jgi:hypothetical protein
MLFEHLLSLSALITGRKSVERTISLGEDSFQDLNS